MTAIAKPTWGPDAEPITNDKLQQGVNNTQLANQIALTATGSPTSALVIAVLDTATGNTVKFTLADLKAFISAA